MAETHAYLSLGANLGDARATIAEALARLDAGGARVVARSADFQTPPWGKLDQPAFINVCAEIATALSPSELLHLCLATEAALGRQRLEKWGPRTIDIDLLTYGEAIVATPELTLPHPHMLQRAFVLVPLLDIAPRLKIAGEPIAAIAAKLPHDGILRLPPRDAVRD
jgi:2-amino-4-hydroxy-6-hydroxymethyldihydropteridine diphosphokinase